MADNCALVTHEPRLYIYTVLRRAKAKIARLAQAAIKNSTHNSIQARIAVSLDTNLSDVKHTVAHTRARDEARNVSRTCWTALPDNTLPAKCSQKQTRELPHSLGIECKPEIHF